MGKDDEWRIGSFVPSGIQGKTPVSSLEDEVTETEAFIALLSLLKR